MCRQPLRHSWVPVLLSCTQPQRPNPARLGNVPKDEPPECVDGEAHIACPSRTLSKRKIRPAKTTNRPRRTLRPFILPSLFQPRLPFPRRLAFRAPRRARSHAGHDLREQNQCRRTTRWTPSTSQILCRRTAATSPRAMQFHEQNLVGGASIQSWIRVGRRANSRPESIFATPIIRRETHACYRISGVFRFKSTTLRPPD